MHHETAGPCSGRQQASAPWESAAAGEKWRKEIGVALPLALWLPTPTAVAPGSLKAWLEGGPSERESQEGAARLELSLCV